MTASPLPLLIALSGVIVYHLSQKAVPGGAHPAVVIGAAYAAGFALCAGFVIATGASVSDTVRQAWRPALGVGVGVLAIEVGFLLAYRAGWPLSRASLIVNVSAALVFVGIGIAVYRESLAPHQWLGVLLCLVGLGLVSLRG